MLVPTENVLPLVSFELAGVVYGLDVASVQEIVRIENPRAERVPVLDLRKRFGLAASEPTRATRIIVVEGAGGTMGLLVDAVRGVLYLSSVTRDPAPETVAPQVPGIRVITNLEHGLLHLLDLEWLPSETELAAISDQR
ncbi:MAG TPA: chemotaxis protein CheW [Stenomitos sp.]